MHMSKSEYQINHVTKSFRVNGMEHKVIDDVSLSISSNDITVILGTSGCGKTTLLRMIAGLERYDGGEIAFYKDDKVSKPRVGIVFQESRLMPWLTVRENIRFHQTINDSEVDPYLQVMKLEKFGDSYPNELSGGMAQRVSIARALSFKPDFLLMDEPFSALDYFTRKDMQAEVVRIHESADKGILFVTHDIDEALTIATRIIVFTKERSIRQFDLAELNQTKEQIKDTILEVLQEKTEQE